MAPYDSFASSGPNSVMFDGFASRQVSAVGWVFDRPDGSDRVQRRSEHGAWIGTKRCFSLEAHQAGARQPAKLRWMVGGLGKTIYGRRKGRNASVGLMGHPARHSDHSIWAWIKGGTTGQVENLFIRDERITPPLRGTANFSNHRHLYSFHPGGAHASMCDGSIRFWAEDASLEILFALATRENLEFVE